MRIRSHIRSNVIGYVALFFSLSLGTAWALENNSVKSKHIRDDQVKSVDVRDDSLSGGGPAGTDIASNSLTAADLGQVTTRFGTTEVPGGATPSGPPQRRVLPARSCSAGAADLAILSLTTWTRNGSVPATRGPSRPRTSTWKARC